MRFTCFTLLLALLLAGCATPSESDSHGKLYTSVTIFHSLPTNIIGSTFVVLGDTNLIGSVEHDSYLKLVQTELEARQLRAVDVSDNPDWLVIVHYQVYPPQKFSDSRPVFGQIGGGGYTQHQGTVWGNSGSSSYSGSSYTAPQYGVVGYRNTEGYWFGWGLRIEFYDGAAYRARRVAQRYEAKSIASGRGGSLAEAIPVMVHQIFREFPGKSGVTREKEISY
jgi:hypothetical protein